MINRFFAIAQNDMKIIKVPRFSSGDFFDVENFFNIFI